MKTDSFVKLLRKIIREEVTSVVRKEMRTLLTEKKSSHSKVIKHGLDIANKTARTNKRYVKDPMLNDILNETGPLHSDRTMNYNSNMAQSFKSMMNSEPDVQHVAPMTDIQGKPVNVNNENVATVVNAMTKDYSALMKAIDKKKGK